MARERSAKVSAVGRRVNSAVDAFWEQVIAAQSQ
jgi:hypothetical protein